MYLKLPLSIVRNTYIKFLVLIGLLFYVQRTAFSQAIVTNSFTYGNNITDQISLFKCESSLDLNVQWSNAQNTDTLVLFFPNSFEISGLSSPYSVTDSIGGFVEIQVPLTNSSGNISFSFFLQNCLNNFALQGSVINTNNLQFQSYLIHPTINDVVTYTYNSLNMPIFGGTPSSVIFPSSAPTFVITPGIYSTNFQGNANQMYSRRFNVRVNTPVVNTFLLSILQESDVEHLELRLIDNNLTNGNSGTLVLNSDTGSANILTQINLTILSNYYTSTDTTKVLTFEQVGRLKCLETNNTSFIRINRPCCPSDLIYFAAMNGRIEEGQSFINSSIKITKADSTINNSCSGSYYYDIKFSKSGPVALIENITIPLNGNFISQIDSVLLVDINNLIHPIESANIYQNPDTLNNRFLFIDLLSEYDSLTNWNGFIDYADSTSLELDTTLSASFGPWLDTTNFTIRIKFQYICTNQQTCEATPFSMQGRGVFHENNPFPHNPLSIVQLTDSTFAADYRIGIRWWNSCESDTISWLNHRNTFQINNQAFIDGFVEMDHEMPEPDLVSYTFYPNGINPFLIQNNPISPSGLSCDTSVSYRAKFYIPLPDESPDSIQRINFGVSNLYVGNTIIPIDSFVFVNDSLLFIPLGQNINSIQPIQFSFEYFLTECPFSDPPNSGGIQLKLEIQAYCDHCEECYKTVACNALNVVVHCPGNCDGQVPMGTENVHMERNTFGFAESTDFPTIPFLNRTELIQFVDSIVDLTNPYLIQIQRDAIYRDELSKLYPFDLVKLTSEGTISSYSNLVSSIGEPFAFNNIAFELAHTPIGNQPLFALKQALLTFIDTLGVDTFSVPLVSQNVNPQNTGVFGMSGDTLFSFELGIANISAYPQLTDTNFSYKLHLEAEFWTLPDAVNPINPIIVRGQFICSTNVDSQITTYSCDPWGTQLRILIPSKQISIESQTDSTSHCNTNAKISVSISGGLGENIDDFPYEFRPIIAYKDTAFSDYYLSGYATQNLTDTIWFVDSTGFFWNTNNLFLNPIEKPDSQHVFLSSRKFCASGSDTLPYTIPIYDFAYLTQYHYIDSLFSPQYLLNTPPLELTQYSFYDSVNTSNTTQANIQEIEHLPWIYSSSSIYDSLIVGLSNTNPMQGIPDSSLLMYDLHIKSPDSLQMGNCWLSYKFSHSTSNAPSIPITTIPFLDTHNYLADTLALDTLGEKFHFFEGGFPFDSLSTTLLMPVECGSLNYRLKLRYGCFCDSNSFAQFKIHPDSIPSCIGDSTILNFQHNAPDVDINSVILVNNDTLGCALTWHIELENPINRPNLAQGKLLINIPSGLVLATDQSTYSYYEQGDTIVSQSGNYLNDSIPPHYSFQFEDFPTPPTTVLVLAFPSVNTIHQGSLLTFDLKFKLDQSTCNLDLSIFQSNFLQRVLEARFTGYSLCNDSVLYVSDNIQQTFIDNSINPSLQSQITSMTDSSGCCMPSAVTVSINHTCLDSLEGSIDFHFSSSAGDNLIQLYQIDDYTNAFIALTDTTIQDTLYSVHLLPGLYSATVTTSGGLIYVFNSLQVQNHGVQPHILLTQNSFCGGSTITLHAVDSNTVNNLGFNASNPFIATDTLVTQTLTYQWLYPNVTIDSLNSSIATATPLTDTTYSVIVSHLSGCIDTAYVNVNVTEIQPINIQLTNDSLCSLMLHPISISPAGGQLTINGITNTNFILDPSIYESSQLNIHYELQSDSGCVSSDSIVVYSTDSLCACQVCEIAATNFMVIPDSVRSSSQLIALLGTDQIAHYCFQLNQSFAIDAYVHFIGCEFTIAGGKEIKISDGVRFDNCVLKGCQQMWAGINNYGKLMADLTLIKDAQYGVLMQRNDMSYTALSNTTFENNFVAIKTSDEIGEHPLTMKGCVFRGGQLMDVYPGQNPIPQHYSLAGIVAVNKYNLDVTPDNRFTQLCNGIILNNKASATLLMALFDNINLFGTTYSGQNYWLDPLTSSSALSTVNGNGIFANSNSYVFFEGFGGLSNSSVCFLNCLKGINVNQSDLEVRNTRFEGMTMGINATNERSKMVKILKNRISSRQSGIRLTQCDFMLPDTIGFNTINSLPFTSQSTFTLNTGIRVSNQYSAFGLKIIGNKITAPQGIYLNTVSGIIVKADTVNIIPMTQSNSFWSIGYGMNIGNSKKYELSCSVVQGNSTNIQSAVNLIKSPFGIIKNNSVNNTNRGFSISDNCQTDSFKLNTITNHQIGLNISATGILGNQMNAGNLWAGNYSITGARRQSLNPATSALSSFTIHNPSLPSIYPLSPPFQPYIGFCLGDFFICNFGLNSPTTPFCDFVNPPSGISTEEPNEDEQRYLAYLLAKDSLNFNEFDEPVKFSLRKDIAYQLSKGQLSLPDTGAFVQFLSQLSQNPETDFVQIDKIQEQIKLNDSTQTVRQSYINLLNLSLKGLHHIDSLMITDSLFDDAILIAQKNELKNNVITLSQQIDLINLIAQEKQQLTRDSAFVFNQGIVTQRDFQEYERRINEIYLNTVAIDSIVFSSAQVAEIEEIARLCPSLGGEAVFKARSLYELISDTAFYNDEMTCLQQGVIFRLSQEDKPSKVSASNYFKVIPNPNNGNFKLKCNLNETQLIEVRIVSTLGQVVYHQKFNFESEEYFDCLLNKAQGVYFIQVFDNSGKMIFTDKLIKN